MSVLSFVNLYGAWFFLSLIPLIILYFLKLRRPKLEVPSLVLWQSVVNDQRVNSPFQKFRRNLLLLLQVLLLCLLVLALMQPFLPTTAGVAEYTPLLIDCSASMSARDEATGRTRLELVLQQVREQIENLSGDQQLAIFTFSATGRRLTDFTNDRRVLLKALDRIEATDLPARLDDVLRMAAAYSTTFPIESVTVLTDGNLPERVDFELPFRLNVRRVDSGGPNLGITEMSARRSGANEWEVFVRVVGSSEDLRGAELQILENGQQTHTETLEVSQTDSERLVFPVTTGAATILEARLIPADFDAMSTDNSVWLSLPATRPLKALVSENAATWRRAIGIVSNVSVEAVQGTQAAGSEYDLIVSRDEVLSGVSAPTQIVVGGVPGDLREQIIRKDGVSTVIDWNRTAPLLRHVQLADVQIGEQPAWADGVTVRDIEARGYEVLVDGSSGPLLLQKREGLKTTWWFTFDTDRSTLPFRVAFPIVAANAVDAALKQASLSEVSAAPTGVLPGLSLDADREYVVTAPSGEKFTGRSGATGVLTGIPAARVGRYEVAEGQDTVAVVGTGLLSVTETSLLAVEELRFTEAAVATGPLETLETDRPLWWTLALLAFGLLMFEWWYFQRARGAVE